MRQVFAKYKTLLSSDNYVTKRMSLKLLGEILLDRSNFNVMSGSPTALPCLATAAVCVRDSDDSHAAHVHKTRMKFISSKENLKTIMLLLRDKSPAIQFEAFHVFKVFVANPKKPPEVGRNRLSVPIDGCTHL